LPVLPSATVPDRVNNWTSADLAERLGGNRTLAHELIAIFLLEYPSLLQSIRASADRQDREAISRSAHAMKGTLANFIDSGPTVTARALERAAADARLADVPALVEQLEGEIQALAAVMRRQTGAR